MTNRKSTTGFPTSYRWTVYVTPKSPKGWLKNYSLFFNKINFNRIESAGASLCENFQWQSCSTVIPLSNGP